MSELFTQLTTFFCVIFFFLQPLWSGGVSTAHPERDACAAADETRVEVTAELWHESAAKSSKAKERSLCSIWVTPSHMACVSQPGLRRPLIECERESAGGNVLTSNNPRPAAWRQHLSQGQRSSESLAWLSLMAAMQIFHHIQHSGHHWYFSVLL